MPEFVAAHRPEQVLCIGRPTVFRQVQALLADSDVEVLLVRPDTDWPTPAHNVRQVGQWFAEPSKPADVQWLQKWQRADQLAREAVARTLAAEPWPSGPAIAADVLATVPWGTTTTYGAIAAGLGLPPGASRAVGAANGANPLPVVLPCHRVLPASGGVGGYAGGPAAKEHLLALEAAHAT